MTEEDITDPTYLYKDGEAKIFHGAEVAEMEAAGWKDTPQPAAETPRRGRPAGSRNKAKEEAVDDSPGDDDPEPEGT